MKKFITFCLLILSLLFVTPNVFAYSEKAYTNDNGVSISYSVKENLLIMGLNETDINNLDQQQYDEFASMNIKYVIRQNQYVESVYEEDESGLVTNVENNYISEKEMKNRVLQSEEPIITYAKNSSAYTTRTTEYKYMTVNATYYDSEGTLGTFYVRVTLKWLKEPAKRYEDVISIAFADNVQITSEYINGNQYPRFTATFSYRQEYRYSYVSILGTDYNSSTTYHNVSKNGANTGSYRYDIDEGVSIKFVLPKETHVYNSGSGWSQTYDIDHYDLYLTLEGRFIPKQQGINATSFAGVYEHQTGSGSIDWGNVSISPAPPYFSYSTSFWVNDPTFDDPLGAPVFFEDLLDTGSGGGGGGGPIEIVMYSFKNGQVTSVTKTTTQRNSG